MALRLGYSIISIPIFLCLPCCLMAQDHEVSIAPEPAKGEMLLAHHAFVTSRDVFGPSGCVKLSRTSGGSCEITTACSNKNISNVEFAFVCMNPGSNLPYALHSFGIGGFAAEENFDTDVKCDRCSTVDAAFQTGGSLLRAALRANSAEELGMDASESSNAAYFGPNACISTYRAVAGTCMIQTQCKETDISTVPIGITCLDPTGDYTRYVFGRGVFDNEELFDTRIECEECLGIGEDPVLQQLYGALPKLFVEDVNSLKGSVEQLKEEVNALTQGAYVQRLTGETAGDTAGFVAGSSAQTDGTATKKGRTKKGEAGTSQELPPTMAPVPIGSMNTIAPMGELAPAPALAQAPAASRAAFTVTKQEPLPVLAAAPVRPVVFVPPAPTPVLAAARDVVTVDNVPYVPASKLAEAEAKLETVEAKLETATERRTAASSEARGSKRTPLMQTSASSAPLVIHMRKESIASKQAPPTVVTSMTLKEALKRFAAGN